MRSRAERWRRLAERLLRASSLALFAWLTWTLFRPAARADATVELAPAALARALPSLALGEPPARVHARLDTVPDATTRDWLIALRRAGTEVSWSGDSIPALAVEVEPIAEPRGGARVLVAAPVGLVRLGDALGALDSARSNEGGAAFAVPRVEGEARAMLHGHVARAAMRDSLRLGRVVVIGRASWESRFVGAALEERGWEVELRQLVAPGLESRRGTGDGVDTSRVAAVVAVDSSATRDARRIAAYVRSGGGLVMLADAARAPALAVLAPARPGRGARPSEISFAADAPRRALVSYPLASLAPSAVVLERTPSGITAAAHRVANGRVLLLGYEESWRWRLSGGGDAPAAHRDWWSRVAASIAHRSERPIEGSVAGDAAPLAALVSALGPATAAPSDAGAVPSRRTLPAWALALLVVMLLAEWGSRRLRGAR